MDASEEGDESSDSENYYTVKKSIVTKSIRLCISCVSLLFLSINEGTIKKNYS